MIVDTQPSVGPLGYWTGCYRKYATFTGRARRAEYWWYTLFNVIILVVLFALGLLVGNSEPVDSIFGALVLVYFVTVFVPSLAVTSRRLRDAGVSGWFLLLEFIPLGAIAVFVMTLLPGTPGPNKYGPDPR
ncbi:MAG TPA: DUF805 domain-containing protein [Micromonosporaceae bacterium]|nr:DUF805 domain-containing protein [Micromonosporaceae bacterium]